MNRTQSRLSSLLIVLFLVCFHVSQAQPETFDLKIRKDSTVGSVMYVTLQVKSNIAPYKLGSSAFFFDYNSQALGAPSISQSFNYVGFITDTMYCPAGLCGYAPDYQLQNTVGRTGIGINLALGFNGAMVPMTYTDILQLAFPILVPESDVNIQWRGTTNAGVLVAPTVVKKDDETTNVYENLLEGLSGPSVPPGNDLAITDVINPSQSADCFGSSETVTVEITNLDGDTIDFSADTVTLYLNITGTNAGFYSTEINTGILAPQGTMLVDIPNVDLSTPGATSGALYTFLGNETNAANDTTAIAFVNVPPPSVTATTISDVLCHGDSTGAIDISVVGDAAPFTFNWDNGATTEDLINLPPGTYSATVTDTNGCTFLTTSLVVGEPDPISLTVDVLTDAGCPQAVDGAISISVVGGVGEYTFSWSNGDTTEDLTGLQPGEYTGMITDANNCLLVSPTLAIGYTDSLPSASIAQNPDGGLIHFFSQSAGADTYYWDFGDGTTDSTENPTHEYTSNDTFMVSLTVGNACGTVTVTDTVYMNSVGVEEDRLGRHVSIYPNPNQGKFEIRFNQLTLEDVVISVHVVDGKEVYNEALGGISGWYIHKVNLPASLAKGIYVLRVSTRQANFYKRIRVE